MGRSAIAAVLVLLCLAAPVALAANQADVFIGLKNVDDLAAADSHQEIGLGLTFGPDGWPVKIAVDLRRSADEDSSTLIDFPVAVEADTVELNVGVRKFWGGEDKIQPYAGAGAALVRLDYRATANPLSVERTLLAERPPEMGMGGMPAELIIPIPLDVDLINDDDSSVGFWIGGGVLWQMSPKFFLGVDARYSDADADLMYTPEWIELLDDLVRETEQAMMEVPAGLTAATAASTEVITAGSGGLRFGAKLAMRW